MTVITLLAVAFVSALIPIVNLEIYLGGLALLAGPSGWWAILGLAAVAATGQMAGKVLFYLAGRHGLALPRWLHRPALAVPVGAPTSRRGRATARLTQRLSHWQQQADTRPWLSAAAVTTSASVGLPPFAIVSVAAGVLRLPLSLFVIAGGLGRWVRFATVLGLVELSTG